MKSLREYIGKKFGKLQGITPTKERTFTAPENAYIFGNNTSKHYREARKVYEFLKNNYQGITGIYIQYNTTDNIFEVSCRNDLVLKNTSATHVLNNSGVPFKFIAINGDFILKNRKALVSLAGCPEYVTGNFDISKCSGLTTFEGCPANVDGDFICSKINDNITEEYIRSLCNVKGNVIIN